MGDRPISRAPDTRARPRAPTCAPPAPRPVRLPHPRLREGPDYTTSGSSMKNSVPLPSYSLGNASVGPRSCSIQAMLSACSTPALGYSPHCSNYHKDRTESDDACRITVQIYTTHPITESDGCRTMSINIMYNRMLISYQKNQFPDR